MNAPQLMELLGALAYNPQTGEFTRTSDGRLSGSLDEQGYCILHLGRKVRIKAHRAAWLVSYGQLPRGLIDHINGNRADNRLTNLRDVSHSENRQNQNRVRSDSKTGLLGVSRDGKKFRAVVVIAGRKRYFGTHSTPELAHAAYLEGRATLRPDLFRSA